MNDLTKLIVITSCTNRKKNTEYGPRRLGLYSSTRLSGRSQQWLQALQEPSVEVVPARELYAGDHWSVMRSLSGLAGSTVDLQLWIVSAGYGLISESTSVSTYSCTFASGQDDSIHKGVITVSKEANSRQWWKELQKWQGPEPGQPRSVEELVRQNPETTLLVVLSQEYLKAIQDDLRRALEAMVNPDRFLIVSVGTERIHDQLLRKHLLPGDARLQQLFASDPSLGRTTMVSLNAKVARRMIEDQASVPLELATQKQRFRDWLDELKPLPKFDRTPMTEVQVKLFIREEVKTNPKTSATQLLRKLRDSGRACEQRRFRQIFDDVKEEE